MNDLSVFDLRGRHGDSRDASAVARLTSALGEKRRAVENGSAVGVFGNGRAEFKQKRIVVIQFFRHIPSRTCLFFRIAHSVIRIQTRRNGYFRFRPVAERRKRRFSAPTGAPSAPPMPMSVRGSR